MFRLKTEAVHEIPNDTFLCKFSIHRLCLLSYCLIIKMKLLYYAIYNNIFIIEIAPVTNELKEISVYFDELYVISYW
jgi:hypothetical protein